MIFDNKYLNYILLIAIIIFSIYFSLNLLDFNFNIIEGATGNNDDEDSDEEDEEDEEDDEDSTSEAKKFRKKLKKENKKVKKELKQIKEKLNLEKNKDKIIEYLDTSKYLALLKPIDNLGFALSLETYITGIDICKKAISRGSSSSSPDSKSYSKNWF